MIVRDRDVLAAAAHYARRSASRSRSRRSIATSGDGPNRARPRRASASARSGHSSTPGIDASVGMAPILPGLSDDPERMADVVRAARDAGATSIWTNVLYLRPGTREHFLENLDATGPSCCQSTRRSTPARAYVSRDVLTPVRRRVTDKLASRYEVADRRLRPLAPAPEMAQPQYAQLPLSAFLRGASPGSASRRRPGAASVRPPRRLEVRLESRAMRSGFGMAPTIRSTTAPVAHHQHGRDAPGVSGAWPAAGSRPR